MDGSVALQTVVEAAETWISYQWMLATYDAKVSLASFLRITQSERQQVHRASAFLTSDVAHGPTSLRQSPCSDHDIDFRVVSADFDKQRDQGPGRSGLLCPAAWQGKPERLRA